MITTVHHLRNYKDMQPKKFYRPDPTAGDELRELSPLLHELRPKAEADTFAPSADYFANMQAAVLAKIEAAPAASPLKSWRNVAFKYAAAATLLLGIVATALLFDTTNTPAPLAKKAVAYEQLLAEIDAADAEAYLLANIDDIDWQLLENSGQNYDDLSAKIYNEAVLDEINLDEIEDYELDDDF